MCAGERFVAEVDLAYPRWRIAIELDGAVHLRRDVHERDLARQNDLVLEGWVVLRFTWRRYTDRPEQLIAEIRTAIARPAARLAACARSLCRIRGLSDGSNTSSRG